jgi:hypothetical protein
MKLFKYFPGLPPELLAESDTELDIVQALSDDFATASADTAHFVSLGISRLNPTVADLDRAIADGETFIALEGEEPFAYVIL